MSLQIDRVVIKNFRNLRNINVKTRNKIVLVGENSVGKSNFMHAIRLLLGEDRRLLINNLSEQDINTNAWIEGEKYFEINVSLSWPEVDFDNLTAAFHEAIDLVDGRYTTSVCGKFSCEVGSSEWHSFITKPITKGDGEKAFADAMRAITPLYYLDAVRDASKELRTSNTAMFGKLVKPLEIVEDELLKMANLLNQTISEDKSIKDLTDKIAGNLKEQIPDISSEGVSLGIPSTNIEDFKSGLIPEIAIGKGAKRQISAYGTGTQNQFLLSLFRSLVDSRTNVFPILAFEEPEAHLHPHAQRRFFKTAYNADAPAIISTHAPTLATVLDVRDLIRFESISAVETRACSADVENDVLDDIKETIRFAPETLFSRTSILVEGESDLILIDACAKEMAVDFDSLSITVAPAGGVSNYASLIKAFSYDNLSIHTVVLFDGDDGADNLYLGLHRNGLLQKGAPDTSANREEKLRIMKELENFFMAVSCTEEEFCVSGYREEAIGILTKNQLAKLLSDYGRPDIEVVTNVEIAKYIAGNKKLKIPFAHAVAKAIPKKKHIPEVFRNAIISAVKLSEK